MVLHGDADTVTDPEISKALYEQAGSEDKTMKLYSGMWHGLTAGETEANVDIVFKDIIAWLDNHTLNLVDGVDKLDDNTPSQTKQSNQTTYLRGLNGHRILHSSM